MPRQIELPANGWRPRPDQKRLWNYLEGGGRRAVAVCHRRWGKDEVALHFVATAMHQRVGTYWHLLPQASQARKAIWDAVNPRTGKRRIDEAFPAELRQITRENEMFIRFQNGSTWQVIGSDNYDSLVGSPPIGVVFSEWALANPNSWAYLRPILAENGGWSLFIYTPRGRNHGATFYEAARKDDVWFAEKLTALDTPVFSQATLEQEKREYVREFGPDDGMNRYNQEYLCDFNAAVVGSYYGREMLAAEQQKRICDLPLRPELPVHTAWDIGVKDSTAIWFVQVVGAWTHVIDYLENSGVGLDWYARELKSRPYNYGEHLWPHDGDITEWGSGKTRIETAMSLGLKPRVLAQRAKQDSINGARLLIPRCKFDLVRTERGVAALLNYRREWDEKRKTFHDRPLHDWSSHGADAFAELAAGDPQNDLGGWGKPLVYNDQGVV